LTKRTNSNFAGKKPTDPEVIVFTGEEARLAAAGSACEPGPNTSTHKNFGKVPKYLEKYKAEAADVAKKREELRAKRALPPGCIQMDEAERIQTLEQLHSTKREL